MALLRMDRLLTMGLFNPWRAGEPGADKSCAPILMYHSVSDDAEKNVSPYYRTCTSPKVFAEQMALLRAEGCQVVGIKRGRELLRHNATGQSRIVVLTFDDGFHDFYSHAAPILEQHGFGATMYLPTAFIGSKRQSFKGRDCMTWGEVRTLHEAGIEFGSHTVSHPKLYELDFPQIREELETSKKVIEQELGAAVPSFAYPYAFPSADRTFVKTFVELLKDAGYESNVTTRIGRMRDQDDPYTLKRLPANSADDGALFLAKIRGAYDWMNWPQDAVKKLKNLVSASRVISEPPPSPIISR